MTRIVWSTQSLMDSVRRDLNWNLEQRHFPRLGEVFPILSFSLSLFLVGAVKHELSFSQLVDRIPRVSSSVGPCLSVLARMHPAELLSGRSHLGTRAPPPSLLQKPQTQAGERARPPRPLPLTPVSLTLYWPDWGHEINPAEWSEGTRGPQASSPGPSPHTGSVGPIALGACSFLPLLWQDLQAAGPVWVRVEGPEPVGTRGAVGSRERKAVGLWGQRHT